MIRQVDQFFVENTGRWAPSTERLYARHLLAVSEWLEAIEVTDSSQVTTELLVRWLYERGRSLSGRRNAIIALRVFFKWVAVDAAAHIPLPKAPVNSSRRALDSQEALRLLAAPDTSNVKGIRDLAIVALMMDTGLRASEVCGVLLSKLNLRQGALQVVVKGGRWEWAIFTDHTQRALENWLAVRKAAKNERHVFVSLGGPKQRTSISSRGLWMIVDELANKAGIGHICPHELRHSFAMLSLRAGASTRQVQLGGRWNDIRQVERYTQRLELESIRPYLPMSYLMEVRE